MKSLKEFIIEKLSAKNEQINEEKYSFIRFEIAKLKNSDELIGSIEKIGERDGFYTEKIDNGIKIKINADSNVESLLEILNEFINAYEDTEDETLKTVYDAIAKIEDIKNPEEDPEEKKEEE